MAELTPNEIARRLETAQGVIAPKFTVSLEPVEFEGNPRYVRWLMLELRLVSNMLQWFFAYQGLTKVTLCWENLQLVKKAEEK